LEPVSLLYCPTSYFHECALLQP